MPTSGSGHITIHFPQVIGIYINGINYSDYIIGYDFKKMKNQVSSFYVNLVSIEDAEKVNVAQGKIVQFRFANNLLFKGTIEKATYETYNYCKIEGIGTVEKILRDTQVEWRPGKSLCDADSEDGRPIYSGTTSGVATSTIVAGQLSGASVSIGTNEYLGHLVARSENDNKLSFLAGIAGNMSGVWWTSYGVYPYTTNYFNIGKAQGNNVSKYVFEVTGDNPNANVTSREVDEESYYNSCTVLGYGDGTNQLRSKVYHATDNFTRLLSGCSISGTVVTVESSTVLPASGTVWIGMEQVPYTSKSGSTLLGCTRRQFGDVDSKGQTYLGRYAHSKGVAVFDAVYTETSTDGNSKIDSMGLKQVTFRDKAIVDQDALDQAAINTLVNSYTLKERISVTPSDLYGCLSGVSVGDTITITDSESGLSGNYPVVGQILSSNEGMETLEYQVGNLSSTFTQDLKSPQEEIKVGSQYMQGSTSIFNVQSYENCDVSNPFHMRFWLPEDLIKVNKADLNFKVKDYRAYTAITNSSSQTIGAYTQNYDTGVALLNHTAGTIADGSGHMWYLAVENPSAHTDIRLGIASGDLVHEFWIGHTADPEDYYIILYDPVYRGGLTMRVSCSAGTTCDFTLGDIPVGGHTHSMSYGISGVFGSNNAVVDVDLGLDGSTLGRVATDQTGTVSLDLSNWIVSGITLSSGNWMDIKLTPDKACRIEANLFAKVFVQAK